MKTNTDFFNISPSNLLRMRHVWRTHIACWITKPTICIAFPVEQRLYERAQMLGHTYTACLVVFW